MCVKEIMGDLSCAGMATNQLTTQPNCLSTFPSTLFLYIGPKGEERLCEPSKWTITRRARRKHTEKANNGWTTVMTKTKITNNREWLDRKQFSILKIIKRNWCSENIWSNNRLKVLFMGTYSCYIIQYDMWAPKLPYTIVRERHG